MSINRHENIFTYLFSKLILKHSLVILRTINLKLNYLKDINQHNA